MLVSAGMLGSLFSVDICLFLFFWLRVVAWSCWQDDGYGDGMHGLSVFASMGQMGWDVFEIVEDMDLGGEV